MSNMNAEKVLECLCDVAYPDFKRDIVSAGFIQNIDLDQFYKNCGIIGSLYNQGD
jgi:metal-sulfur cluster biosynthetic enzyme